MIEIYAQKEKSAISRIATETLHAERKNERVINEQIGAQWNIFYDENEEHSIESSNYSEKIKEISLSVRLI